MRRLYLSYHSSGATSLSHTGASTAMAFKAARDFRALGSPRSFIRANVNNDTLTDLVIAHDSGVSILLGNGDGTFAARTDFATGGHPACITAGDFDNDGDMDLLVLNLNDRPRLLRNDGGNRLNWLLLLLWGSLRQRRAIGTRLRAFTLNA